MGVFLRWVEEERRARGYDVSPIHNPPPPPSHTAYTRPARVPTAPTRKTPPSICRMRPKIRPEHYNIITLLYDNNNSILPDVACFCISPQLQCYYRRASYLQIGHCRSQPTFNRRVLKTSRFLRFGKALRLPYIIYRGKCITAHDCPMTNCSRGDCCGRFENIIYSVFNAAGILIMIIINRHPDDWCLYRDYNRLRCCSGTLFRCVLLLRRSIMILIFFKFDLLIAHNSIPW